MIDPTGLHTGGHDAMADALVWQDVLDHLGVHPHTEAQVEPAKESSQR
eukprot:CAMPEP_0196722174 /NCGR_PEP_ID=MMETSP1091-20130531/4586_1 /TAXON_ID=302021 /ORGANISM="Rhodomonas sp., Strain CCMP768" /LENGTH=47 /DNA_ID= /DNA_START= /DNA_END= /DNA_ORIENTATION=